MQLLNPHELCQCTKWDGAWFPKDMGENIQTFGPMGKKSNVKGKHTKLSTPFCLTQSFLLLEIGWVVLLHGDGTQSIEIAQGFDIESISFWKRVLTPW